MALHASIFASSLAWCEAEWWFSLTPSRKEKFRVETSLANRNVTFRVVSVQNARTIRSSIRRTNSGGSMLRPSVVVALSPPLSLLVNSTEDRAISGGGVSLSGLVGGRQPSGR